MIDVYGGIFTDIYIEGTIPHKKIVDILPGGSGFNIATGLSFLGNKIRFFGNIGNDVYSDKIISIFLENNINIDYLIQHNSKSDVFVSQNSLALAIERKINNMNFETPNKISDYAFINTEINKKMINKILKMNYKKIFIDSGPRHHILEDILKEDNHFLISNKDSSISTEIIDLGKMDKHGFYYKNDFYPSNGKDLKYKFGTGDLLDSLFIDCIINNSLNKEKIKSFIKIIEKTDEIKGSFNKMKILKKLDG